MERPKIEILLQFIDESKGNQWLETGMALVPENRQLEFRQYLSPIDSLRSLTAWLLVSKLLKIGPTQLGQVERDEWQRPSLAASQDFNISHCQGLAAAASISHGRIGLDVEAWRAVPLDSFERVFTEQELAYIQNSDHFEQAFFRIWTRKEALIKADGRGMHLDLKSLDVLPERVQLDTQTWQITDILLPEGWSAAMATPVWKGSTSIHIFQAGQESIWLAPMAQIART